MTHQINGTPITSGKAITTELPARLTIRVPSTWPSAWVVVNDQQPGAGYRRRPDNTIELLLPAAGGYEVAYCNGLNARERDVFRVTIAAGVTPPVPKWGKGIISDVGTVAQLVSVFGPMGVNAMRPWVSHDAVSGAITGAGRVLQCNDLVKAGWMVDPVLSCSPRPRRVAMPDLNTLAKTLSKSVAGIGCYNEIDHDEYWPGGTTPAGFANACQHSQAVADKLKGLGYRADSFSLSRVNAGEITASWKIAKALGCTRWAAIRGHAYDWHYDGNPTTFLLKIERIVTEFYGVAQSLGLPLKIDEIGLPPERMGSRRTMSPSQIAYVVPRLWAMLRRYTVASYVFIATPTNKTPHDWFPRLTDDLVKGTRTPFGQAFAAA